MYGIFEFAGCDLALVIWNPNGYCPGPANIPLIFETAGEAQDFLDQKFDDVPQMSIHKIEPIKNWREKFGVK